MAYKTVSESTIRQAAELSGPNNNFYTAIRFADNYREAGMSPVFYTDDEEKIIYVTTEEKMNGSTFH